MQTCNIPVVCLMILLVGCAEQKPKGDTPSDAVVEQKEAETSPTDSAAMTQGESPATEAGDVKKPAAKPLVEKNVTIIGEVIDLASYAISGVRGSSPTGKEVIETGARRGNPLGILEKGSGDVYIVTMRQANTSADSVLLAFVGLNVAAKGDVHRKGGQQLLLLSTIGKSIK